MHDNDVFSVSCYEAHLAYEGDPGGATRLTRARHEEDVEEAKAGQVRQPATRDVFRTQLLHSSSVSPAQPRPPDFDRLILNFKFHACHSF